MSTRSTHRQSDLPSHDGTTRPLPVEVLLDDNTPLRPATKSPAAAPSAANGHTLRRTILVLAVGALGGALLSQGLARSDRSSGSTSTAAAPVIGRPSVDDLPAARTTGAPIPVGTVVDLFIDTLDAVTTLRVAHVADTDGPQQAAAMEFLHQRRDDTRTMIVTIAYGVPYPLP